jgi:hypothetical protein
MNEDDIVVVRKRSNSPNMKVQHPPIQFGLPMYLTESPNDQVEHIGNIGNIDNKEFDYARHCVGFYTYSTPFLLSGNHIFEIRDMLDNGSLDFNETFRRGKKVIDFVTTREMLQMLIQHGLDVHQGKGLLRCTFPIFQILIQEYKVDPFEYFSEFTNRHKIEYINRIIEQRRKDLTSSLFKSPLIPPLISIVIDYICPKVRSSKQ